MNRQIIIFSIMVISMLTAAACGGLPGASSAAAPTPLPTVIVEMSTVAEGRVVPNDDVTVSFLASGQVEEILVEKDDVVKAGQVLARLGTREEIESALARSRVELIAAQQARKTLDENVSVQRAALTREISALNKRQRDAQYNLDNYTVPSYLKDLEPWEGVVKMKAILDEARAAFEAVESRPSGDETRKDRKEDLDNAQSDYNSSVRQLELVTALEDVTAQLDKAMQDLADLVDGPDPDDLAAAEARIAAAEAAIAASEAALAHLELIATIDGTVLEQNLQIGQIVVTGTPVMRLVDFSQMYVETDDLTELEVVNVKLGQKVRVRADALRDVELTGTVVEISNIFEEKRGDITYTVKIQLDTPEPRLRWGMTVEVTFEE